LTSGNADSQQGINAFPLWMTLAKRIFFVNLVFMPQFGHPLESTNAVDLGYASDINA
jgi:hypothetical protein